MESAVEHLKAAGIPARIWVKRNVMGKVSQARIYVNDGRNPFNRCTATIVADRETLTVSIAMVDAIITKRA